MSTFRLAFSNIKGHGLRSLIIFLCVFGVAVFFVSVTLVIRGAQNSLNKGLERLGADIIVVPEGAETKVETALLIGKPTNVWMSKDNVDAMARVPGVAAVTPQVYLQSLFGADCCAVDEMFLIVYDPGTDFTVAPWLERNLGRGLNKGEVIGGSYIFMPEGMEYIQLYGYNLDLKGLLNATGTGLDQTLFMTLETAEDMARSSLTTAERPLVVPQDQVSTIMVKTMPGVDVHQVAVDTLAGVPGVFPIESPRLFGTFRQQMLGLLWGFVAMLTLAWLLSIVFVGLIFSMAANERRREMAVLRALGATRLFVFRTVVTEGVLLAVAAAVLGIGVASLVIYMLKDYLAASLRMPFLFPSPGSFLTMFLTGVLLSLLTVGLATFLPAYRSSFQEPAIAMRE